MIGFLRVIGLFNAALWLGATIFFTFLAGPAFFSDEMKHFIPPPYNGVAAQIVISRYFLLQNACAAVALLHLAAGWIYFGRRTHRFMPGLLATLLLLGLGGGYWLQPHLKHLHAVKYFGRTAAERADAAHAFGFWHGLSQMGNLLVLTGLLYYFWVLTWPEKSAAGGIRTKLRG